MRRRARAEALAFAASLALGGLGLAACVDAGSNEEDSAPGGGGGAGPAIPEAPLQKIHPILSVTDPLRGSFTQGDTVSVRGRTQKGSARIETLKVNGEVALLTAGGDFDHSTTLEAGPNILGLRLEAEDRGRAVDAVTVFRGPVHEPGATLSRALLIHAGPKLLDDDEPDLDDIAGIIESMILEGGYLDTFENASFESDFGEITLRSLELGDVSVDLTPVPDCLGLTLTVTDGFVIELIADPDDFLATFGSEITMRTDHASISTALCPKMENGVLITEVSEEATLAEFDADSFNLSTNEHPNLAEELPTLHEAMRPAIEGLISERLGGALGGLVDGFLGGFAIERSFGTDPVISVRFEIEEVFVTRNGLDLSLKGGFSTPLGLSAGPPGAGSLRTDDPAPNQELAPGQELVVAISDDALNQLFFAYWWGGITSGLGLDEALEGQDLEALPKVFQPLTSIGIDGMLPPTFIPVTDAEKFQWDLAMGELNLDLLAGTDRRFRTTLHVRTGAILSITEEGLLAVGLDNRARRMTVHVAVHEVPGNLNTGDLAALLRMMVPSLLGEAKAFLGGLPMPTISLSLFGEMEAFQGRALALRDPVITKIGEGGGYLVAAGGVENVAEPPPAPPE